jgi:oligoribonuclease (3'-5' exoribonuclease)
MTSNKSAMQQLRHKVEQSSIISKSAKKIVIEFIKDFIKEEKEQIIEAYHIPGSNIRTKEEGEKYYNQRYNINV